MGIHPHLQNDGNRDSKSDEISRDIGCYHCISNRHGALTVLYNIPCLAKECFPISPTFKGYGKEERNGPDYDGHHPDDEKATEHNSSEEMPVQEADGQFNEADGGHTHDEKSELNLRTR